MRSIAPTTALIALAAVAAAQPPTGYYATVTATSATQLRATLHAVIDDHVRIPYTASSTDTWNVLELADQAPGSTTQILDLYKNTLYQKQGGGNTFYNREHVWPNSYGFPVDGATNYPYTDCHALFLCDIAYNAARDNSPFLAASASWTEFATTPNGGQGGGTGAFPGNSNWSNASLSPIGGWQTWNGRRGDVARALFYMDVRYEGGTHGGTGASEPDLRLTDDLSLVQASATGNNVSVAHMGRLSTLLQWHQEDPVDGKEIQRNNAVFAAQGNRNPFIDNPAWAQCLYLGQCLRVRHAEIWINELHYDNTGADVGEFVELAGPATMRLNGWMLLAVDGATGQPYARLRLGGAFPNQQNGYGTLSFAFAGLQDGPDAIALVSADGAVVHFIAYEGACTGVGGAIAGAPAVQLPISEPASTPVGQSLQLTGTGNHAAMFTWSGPAVATPGQKNAGQTFQ
jgi:endonuclease I